MDWDEIQPTRLRTKLAPRRIHGPRKRKHRRPTTPHLRRRQGQAQIAVMGRNGSIRLRDLPVSWRVGRRIYWKVQANRSVIGALCPKGTLHKGRYITSRLRR